MKKLGLIWVFLLSGCMGSVPVRMEFPELPEPLRQSCAELTTIEGTNITLSGLVKSVSDNYSKYHECKVKQEAFVEWYEIQKKIWDEAAPKD